MRHKLTTDYHIQKCVRLHLYILVARLNSSNSKIVSDIYYLHSTMNFILKTYNIIYNMYIIMPITYFLV